MPRTDVDGKGSQQALEGWRRLNDSLAVKVAPILALLVVYSPMVVYDFGHHGDFITVAGDRLSHPILGPRWDFFFAYFESSTLILIGRLVNAVLVSIQAHLMTSVEALTALRAFYVGVLCVSAYGFAWLLVRHFRMPWAAASVVSFLVCASPPLQQGILIVTFSAPLLVSLWAAVSAYVLFARRPVGASRAGLILPLLLVALSMSCYPLGTMAIAALGVLDLVIADRAGWKGGMAPIRFTARVLVFLAAGIVVFALADRLIYYIVFADTPAIVRLTPPAFYRVTLSDIDLAEGLEARWHNLVLAYLNAASLWDMQGHTAVVAGVTILLLASVVLPVLRMLAASVLHPRWRWDSVWSAHLRGSAAAAACKVALFVTTILPLLVPSVATGWFTGYRDAFRTLPAMEAAMVFLLYGLCREWWPTVHAVLLQAGAGPRLRFARVSRQAGRSAVAIALLAATVLAFHGANAGALWAHMQHQLYAEIYDRVARSAPPLMVVPCGRDGYWKWHSPGFKGEYGYTSLGWETYIQVRLKELPHPVETEVVCSYRDVRPGPGGEYVYEDFGVLYVDYERFIRDMAPVALERSWRPPWRRDPDFLRGALSWRPGA